MQAVGGLKPAWVPCVFHVERGDRARLFHPCTCPETVPKGLEPDEIKFPCNVCMFPVKSCIQKSAPETKKKKVNLFEQKEFLFLQATPAYKPS